MKKKTDIGIWRPFRKNAYRAAWYDKKIAGIASELKRDIRRCHDRIFYGFCDYDLYAINDWFIKIMPVMLKRFRDQTHSYPLLEGYTARQIADREESGYEEWKAILTRMIWLLREADEDHSSKKNPLQAEYDAAVEKFEKKYGMFGQKLMTKRDRDESKKTGRHRLYTLSDVDEYKELVNKWLKEEERLSAYRKACQEKALSLFSKYFDDLWD